MFLVIFSADETSQVVITGDFFQLPPVCKNKPMHFAFEAVAWKQTIKRAIRLTQVFRQKDKGKHLGLMA
jgi:ATP-dependent DNA helicase PIF1